MLNNQEKKHLQFLVSMTNEQYEQWLDNATDSQVDFAIKLMEDAKREMNETITSLEVVMDSAEDLQLAKSVLSQFTLKGKHE